MAQTNSITTIKEFIDALGGERPLANQFGLCTQAIIQWKVRNHISAGFHLRLLALARRNGIDVAPEVFGMKREDVKELFHKAHPTSLTIAA